MKLLVVGGAGYIGSVVAAQLSEAGHSVTVADNLSKGHDWAVPPKATFVEVDVLDAPALGDVVGGGFDGVLHFAALSLVGESVAEPVRYFRTNVAGTLNLLDAIRAAEVPRLVFSSTAATYGEPEDVPIPETAATVPTNPYGASKLSVDMAIGAECAAAAARGQNFGATSLRYFNVAGAYGSIGERHATETHLIPLVLQEALRVRGGGDPEKTTLLVNGDDYPTPDGTAVRDYIHVEDLARAHLLALDAISPGTHTIYNLGNGTGFSVREVVEACRG